MGRYLSPGRLIQITQDEHELIGYVVWCKPTQHTETFLAGIRFIETGIEASFTVLSARVQDLLGTRQHNTFNQEPISVQ